MKYSLIFFFMIYCQQNIIAQELKHPGDPLLYRAGYINITGKDSGRRYKPGVEFYDKYYFRSVEIDIWYPASWIQSAAPLMYGDFFKLPEQRSNSFQNDTVYSRLTSVLVQYISSNLKVRDTMKLMQLKTLSYLKAVSIPKRFPLILYMCTYNGMSYENIMLFEWLAENGYVVACIESTGRYPGNMSTQPEDLLEQVNDGIYAINHLKRNPNVDSTNIGVIGYGWGGLAGLLLVMHQPGLKAFLSLNGSELHYFGDSKTEDRDFEELIHSNNFRPENLNISYAYLESGFKQTTRQVDSIYNILPSIRQQKIYIHFPKATHEDFTCLPWLVPGYSKTRAGNTDLYNIISRFSLNYFDVYLKKKNNILLAQLTRIYQQKIGDSTYPVRLKRPK